VQLILRRGLENCFNQRPSAGPTRRRKKANSCGAEGQMPKRLKPLTVEDLRRENRKLKAEFERREKQWERIRRDLERRGCLVKEKQP
jgi:hypothetical protein